MGCHVPFGSLPLLTGGGASCIYGSSEQAVRPCTSPHLTWPGPVLSLIPGVQAAKAAAAAGYFYAESEPSSYLTDEELSMGLASGSLSFGSGGMPSLS